MGKTRTAFQEAITLDDLAIAVQLAHPDLPDGLVRKRLESTNRNYSQPFTWQSVHFQVAGYGHISLSIDNHSYLASAVSALKGPISVREAQDLVTGGNIGFHLWRSNVDVIAHKVSLAMGDELSLQEIKHAFENYTFDPALYDAYQFIQSKYSPPSADEFYHHYMKKANTKQLA